MTITRDELATLATLVYGSEWQTRLARERGVEPRTVRRWAAEGIAKPDTAIGIRAYLMSRRIVDLPPPLSDDADERDDSAHLVVPVVLDKIVESGRAVGWHDAELLAATLSWCVDRMVMGAGVIGKRRVNVSLLEAVLTSLDRKPDRSAEIERLVLEYDDHRR